MTSSSPGCWLNGTHRYKLLWALRSRGHGGRHSKTAAADLVATMYNSTSNLLESHGWAIPPFWVNGPRRESCCHSSVGRVLPRQTDGRISIRWQGAAADAIAQSPAKRSARSLSCFWTPHGGFETKLARGESVIFDIETWHEISHASSQQEAVRSRPSETNRDGQFWPQATQRSYGIPSFTSARSSINWLIGK